MATWQFSVAFVPNGAPVPVASYDGFEVECLSQAETIEAIASLTSHFGAPRAVLPGWQQFGLERGNRVDLSFEGARAELSARIDARDPDHMLTFVCALASQLRCRLFLPESQALLAPESALLQGVFRESGASRFVASPRGFLEGRGSAV